MKPFTYVGAYRLIIEARKRTCIISALCIQWPSLRGK